jgi:hypothetical protein
VMHGGELRWFSLRAVHLSCLWQKLHSMEWESKARNFPGRANLAFLWDWAARWRKELCRKTWFGRYSHKR